MTTAPSPALLVGAAGQMLAGHPGAENVRAAAILARQGLEGAVDEFWIRRGLAAMTAAARANQFICLPSYVPEGERDLAARATYLWNTLSGFAHHHPYELVVLAIELLPLIESVERAVSDLGALVVTAVPAASSASRINS